jgi:alpha-tubulin suppressor-like RCC1 family protein
MGCVQILLIFRQSRQIVVPDDIRRYITMYYFTITKPLIAASRDSVAVVSRRKLLFWTDLQNNDVLPTMAYIGENTTMMRKITLPTQFRNVTAIACGYRFLMITDGNTVLSYTNTQKNLIGPFTEVMPVPGRVLSLSCGYGHTAAVIQVFHHRAADQHGNQLEDRTYIQSCVTWGSNHHGQIGRIRDTKCPLEVIIGKSVSALCVQCGTLFLVDGYIWFCGKMGQFEDVHVNPVRMTFTEKLGGSDIFVSIGIINCAIALKAVNGKVFVHDGLPAKSLFVELEFPAQTRCQDPYFERIDCEFGTLYAYPQDLRFGDLKICDWSCIGGL